MAAYADPTTQVQRLTGLPNDLTDYFLGYSNPQAGFYEYLGRQGLAGLGARAQFAQSQFGDEYQRYLAQKPNNMGESFRGYLSRVRPDYTQQLKAMDARERGVNTSVSMPRVRWNL